MEIILDILFLQKLLQIAMWLYDIHKSCNHKIIGDAFHRLRKFLPAYNPYHDENRYSKI